MLEAAQNICDAPDLSIVVQELLTATHHILGFERVRFYLALPECGVLRREGVEGLVDDDGDQEIPLLSDHLLGQIATGSERTCVARVGNLIDAEESAKGVPTCLVQMQLPEGDLGIVVADNPVTCCEITGRQAHFVGLLARFAAFPMERTRHEESQIRMRSLVSHELRTPLTSIAAFAEMLLDGDAGELNGKQQRFVQRITRAASQLQQIVQDLLELAHLAEGSDPLEKTSIAIEPFLEDTSQNLLPQAAAKQIKLVVEASDDLPNLHTDERRLQQALSNLIDNAIKYSAPNTTVRITAVVRESQVRLAVIDRGPGIAPEHRERIFEEFFRAYPTEEGLADKGSGLGLAIVKGLGKMLGAKVEIESALGKGSTFALVFPVENQ